MTHALKTWPQFFSEIVNGNKTFELRKDDRPFEVGDKMVLQEYDPKEKKYSGKEETKIITYILRGDMAKKFGLRDGFCLISFTDPSA